MVKQMNRENENLYEALRIIRERKYKPIFTNPWEDQSLTRGKITEIDYSNKTAEVQIDNQKITVPITDDTFDLICEMGNTYGATAFIQNNTLVNFSYQTLTPVRQESEEVIVYE